MTDESSEYSAILMYMAYRYVLGEEYNTLNGYIHPYQAVSLVLTFTF